MNFIAMAINKDKPCSETSAGGSKRAGGAFDIWLQRGLHQLFDEVASEPIPEELLRLIEDDRARE